VASIDAIPYGAIVRPLTGFSGFADSIRCAVSSAAADRDKGGFRFHRHRPVAFELGNRPIGGRATGCHARRRPIRGEGAGRR
jgi:hypothetical protein